MDGRKRRKKIRLPSTSLRRHQSTSPGSPASLDDDLFFSSSSSEHDLSLRRLRRRYFYLYFNAPLHISVSLLSLSFDQGRPDSPSSSHTHSSPSPDIGCIFQIAARRQRRLRSGGCGMGVSREGGSLLQEVFSPLGFSRAGRPQSSFVGRRGTGKGGFSELISPSRPSPPLLLPCAARCALCVKMPAGGMGKASLGCGGGDLGEATR